jgi:hypothetical protein
MRIFKLLCFEDWKIPCQSAADKSLQDFSAILVHRHVLVFWLRLSKRCMSMQMNFKSIGHERKAEKMVEWALASLFT